jgi:hypothetical protein
MRYVKPQMTYSDQVSEGNARGPEPASMVISEAASRSSRAWSGIQNAA